ncbi:MAG: hypothetical protein A4E27_01544 [Methanobacterium sp. PtaU1.Bin242]|nr:MAG: hypothetical protein A4E27_01544 [Methanobacterium sp. PtaU1.Bin242]
MTDKDDKPLMERKGNIGPFSNCASIRPQKEGFRDVICDICDKVFKTDMDVYICPSCQEKAKKST